MLRRQKMLLAILHSAMRDLTATELVKFAFLLRHETDVSSDHAFYDFVPYKYGPFSFALYRELEALEKNGYVNINDGHIRLCGGAGSSAIDKIRELSHREAGSVADVASRYRTANTDALLRDVYARYPWFTINSERADLIGSRRVKRPTAKVGIYTSGYEGKSVDGFFDNLLQAGIRSVIDVRFNPVSRKYGFAGSSIRRIGEKLGLTYAHVPELGISGDHRESLDSYESYQRLMRRYETSFLTNQEPSLRKLEGLIRSGPSVLVCMEKDVRCCHRGRLAAAMSDRMQLPVSHL